MVVEWDVKKNFKYNRIYNKLTYKLLKWAQEVNDKRKANKIIKAANKVEQKFRKNHWNILVGTEAILPFQMCNKNSRFVKTKDYF